MPMPETEYVSKTKAIEDVREATGYGRLVIDRKIDDLADEGKIIVYEDPGDRRRKIISRAHVKIIIAALTFQPPTDHVRE